MVVACGRTLKRIILFRGVYERSYAGKCALKHTSQTKPRFRAEERKYSWHLVGPVQSWGHYQQVYASMCMAGICLLLSDQRVNPARSTERLSSIQTWDLDFGRLDLVLLDLLVK